MTTVAVISAIYGGYDEPAAMPEQDHPAEYVMVSDREYFCPPWRNIVEPRPSVHPRLAAKYPKARPFDYTDADIAIWVDGNMRVASPFFVSWCIDQLGDAPLALTPHNQVSDIEGELRLAEPLAKYDGQPMREQAAHYRKHLLPAGAGHWWTGLIIRRRRAAPHLHRVGDVWLREMLRWGYEDQISLPWALHETMTTPPKPLEQGWPIGLFGWSQHNAEAAWGQR